MEVQTDLRDGHLSQAENRLLESVELVGKASSGGQDKFESQTTNRRHEQFSKAEKRQIRLLPNCLDS